MLLRRGVTVLGECEPVPAITGTLVTPVIGFVASPLDLSALRPSPDEVRRCARSCSQRACAVARRAVSRRRQRARLRGVLV